MLKRSSKSKGCQYPTAFKLKAIKRVERAFSILLRLEKWAPARLRKIEEATRCASGPAIALGSGDAADLTRGRSSALRPWH